MIKLPVSTRELSSFMPHRAPMVWVDYVEEVSEIGGTCSVVVDPTAHYMQGQTIRWTAPIEWIAQSYGFIKAVQIVNEIFTVPEIPKVTFLAQVRDAELFEPLQGERFLVKVSLRRALGPMSLVEGVIENPAGTKLAVANLKLFAQ